jgi:hypothetical protein
VRCGLRHVSCLAKAIFNQSLRFSLFTVACDVFGATTVAAQVKSQSKSMFPMRDASAISITSRRHAPLYSYAVQLKEASTSFTSINGFLMSSEPSSSSCFSKWNLPHQCLIDKLTTPPLFQTSREVPFRG